MENITEQGVFAAAEKLANDAAIVPSKRRKIQQSDTSPHSDSDSDECIETQNTEIQTDQ